MALFQPILGNLSGSIGGNVFAHNQGGKYVRVRSVPTNPNTTEQQAVKALMDNLNQTWKVTLVQAQRDGWANYAANTPVVDSLGEQRFLSGRAWYLGTNILTQRFNVSAPQVFNVPLISGRAETPVLEIDDSLTLDLTAVTNAGNLGFMQLQWAGPFPPSVNFFKGPFPASNRLAGAIADVITANPMIPTAIAGEVYFIRSVGISNLRVYSPPIIQRVVIQP